jgi:hypothetical protein
LTQESKKDLITLRHAAEMFDYHENSIRRLVRDKKISPFSRGEDGKSLVSKRELNLYLAQQRRDERIVQGRTGTDDTFRREDLAGRTGGNGGSGGVTFANRLIQIYEERIEEQKETISYLKDENRKIFSSYQSALKEKEELYRRIMALDRQVTGAPSGLLDEKSQQEEEQEHPHHRRFIKEEPREPERRRKSISGFGIRDRIFRR